MKKTAKRKVAASKPVLEIKKTSMPLENPRIEQFRSQLRPRRRRFDHSDLSAAILLLAGGLLNSFPGLFTPIAQSIGVGSINLQVVLGVFSVIVALYLIFEKSR